MSKAFIDIMGIPVTIGDVLAVAFRSGNTAELRVGEIIGFGTKKGYGRALDPATGQMVDGRVNLLEIRWEKTGHYGPDTSKMEADNGRYLKIK